LFIKFSLEKHIHANGDDSALSHATLPYVRTRFRHVRASFMSVPRYSCHFRADGNPGELKSKTIIVFGDCRSEREEFPGCSVSRNSTSTAKSRPVWRPVLGLLKKRRSSNLYGFENQSLIVTCLDACFHGHDEEGIPPIQWRVALGFAQVPP